MKLPFFFVGLAKAARVYVFTVYARGFQQENVRLYGHIWGAYVCMRFQTGQPIWRHVQQFALSIC